MTKGRTVVQTSKLPNLPNDILYLIFKEAINDFTSLACGAITCKALLSAALPHLRKAYVLHHAPWNGTRLICLGEYTDDSDLPPGLLTQEERREVDAYSRGLYSLEELEKRKWLYYDFASGTYSYPSGSDHSIFLLFSIWEVEDNDASLKLCHKRDKKVLQALHSRFYRSGERLLFNLTKGECVRENALYRMEVDDEDMLGLDHVLLSRICWSSSPNNNAMWLEDDLGRVLGRGPWAGDRFCIATLEEMPRAEDGREWKDVSKEAVAFLHHVWRHAYRHEPLCRSEHPSDEGAVTEDESGSGDETEDESGSEGEMGD